MKNIPDVLSCVSLCPLTISGERAVALGKHSLIFLPSFSTTSDRSELFDLRRSKVVDRLLERDFSGKSKVLKIPLAVAQVGVCVFVFPRFFCCPARLAAPERVRHLTIRASLACVYIRLHSASREDRCVSFGAGFRCLARSRAPRPSSARDVWAFPGAARERATRACILPPVERACHSRAGRQCHTGYRVE